MKRKVSAQDYWRLLYLQSLGCPVDCEHLPRMIQPLRIETVGSYLNTNLYPLEGSAAFILPLHIYVATPIIVYGYYLRLQGFGYRVSRLAPSKQHPEHYLLPPGIYIPKSSVLNHILHPAYPLRRNIHLSGLLLGTIPEDIPSSAGATVRGVLGIEDVDGREYCYPISIENRQLDPDLLGKYGEEATFPPPPPAAALDREAGGDRQNRNSFNKDGHQDN
jgi:hypothetical protein